MNFIIALLLFIPTTFFNHLEIYLIVSFFYIFKMTKNDFNTLLFKLIILISILSITNYFICSVIGTIYISVSGSVLANFPYGVFLIPAYIIAKNINSKILNIILILILIEIVIGILEYSFSIQSFLSSNTEEFQDTELLYNKRVYGLSSNSSVLALKCFIGVVILYINRLQYQKLFISVAFILIILGFYITFNRSYILSVSILVIAFFNRELIKQKLLLFIISISMFAIIYYFSNTIENQFLRGINIDNISAISSGRDVVYENFFYFFLDHFHEGNGSVKLWLNVMGNKTYHAHNSFLMTFASNGFWIGLLYIFMLIMSIKKSNMILIISFILASIFQYTIFWGISLCDIILLYVLLDSPIKKYISPKNTNNKTSLTTKIYV